VACEKQICFSYQTLIKKMASDEPNLTRCNIQFLYQFIDEEWKALGGLLITNHVMKVLVDIKWQERNGVDGLARPTDLNEVIKLKDLARERAAELFRAEEKMVKNEKEFFVCSDCGKSFRFNANNCLIHILTKHSDYPAFKSASKI
jgi:hypothetical protein